MTTVFRSVSEET